MLVTLYIKYMKRKCVHIKDKKVLEADVKRSVKYLHNYEVKSLMQKSKRRFHLSKRYIYSTVKS